MIFLNITAACCCLIGFQPAADGLSFDPSIAATTQCRRRQLPPHKTLDTDCQFFSYKVCNLINLIFYVILRRGIEEVAGTF